MKIERVTDETFLSYISEFNNSRGVIAFGLFKVHDVGALSEEETHFKVAREMMLDLTSSEKNYKSRFPDFIGTNSNNEIYKFDESKLVGTSEKLSVKEFFGAYHNYEQDKLFLETEGVYHQDRETKFGFNCNGYTYSFLDPPYGFSMPNKAEFFVAFSKYLFSDFGNIIVYSWGTDCSNYFDPGKDWWGHFLCTICNPEKDWYIGIVASSTD